jgi:P pilus assembly chaperone PapD
MRGTILALGATLWTARSLAAMQAVLLAPQAVVVDGKAGTGAFTVFNPTAEPVEMTVSTLFGYPVTYSLGRMYLRTFAETEDTMPSAARWIESYPRRFTLGAGARRTVRLLVTAPPGTPDREYWARLVIASRSGTGQRVASQSPGVDVVLNLEVRSVIPVLYRRGEVKTALTVENVAAAREQDSLVVRPALIRHGNAAWVGTVRASLLDQSGRSQRQAELPLGVYYSLEPRVALPLEGIAPGTYQLRIDAVGQRSDLPPQFLLPTLPVSRVVSVVVP